MSETRPRFAGSGIAKTSARPVKVVVDSSGEYWICDKSADLQGSDFLGAGCVAHSHVHLVK
jgi:hypothetical protein